MQIPVYVEVSNNYLWTLEAFCHLFNIYWSNLQPVTIYGFSRPSYNLPSNFNFQSVNRNPNRAEEWSNTLIEFLNMRNDNELFVLLLCDYWLVRTVDHRAIPTLADYMSFHPDVLRMDLTTDRLYAGGMFDVDMWGHYDIIETPHGTPYQMSLQAGIWRKSLILEILSANKTAWETELHTHPPRHMRVLGTRQYPIRYANAVLKGKINTKQLALIPEEHKNYIFSTLPKEWSNHQ